MKIKYYNILPSVVMMILIIIHNWGVSGGDILIQFSIIFVTFIQVLYQSVLRVFIKFDLFRNIKELLLVGAIIFINNSIFSSFICIPYVLKWY
ncbi:MAG: hypothetical protein HG457_003520 [Flavobacteriaceae bacterium]|nr:hypothetical protein [Flavobacteriaceae bacterium]